MDECEKYLISFPLHQCVPTTAPGLQLLLTKLGQIGVRICFKCIELIFFFKFLNYDTKWIKILDIIFDRIIRKNNPLHIKMNSYSKMIFVSSEMTIISKRCQYAISSTPKNINSSTIFVESCFKIWNLRSLHKVVFDRLSHFSFSALSFWRLDLEEFLPS